VWVRDPDGLQAWLPATVQSKLALGSAGGGGLQDVEVELEDDDHYGQHISFPCMLGHSEADDIKLRNRDEDDEIEDLIDLPFLHEPAILHALHKRFEKGQIYTFTGPILIAVNPFQRLPLYTDQILQSYYSAGLMRSQGMADLTEKVHPHVYAISDNAYRAMMQAGRREKGAPPVKQNQAILISGESGAGKTESTKIVMRYLTAVGNQTGSSDFEQGSVMDRVLQSNPILEAFGNARTNRNDNSSRFGKYIELLFNRRGNLVGAAIETYLLEKVRLASQLPGERNFHIFYQLTASRNEAVVEQFGVNREELALGQPQSYRYINQGGIYTLRGVDDAEELNATQHAMDVLRFSQESQADIVRLTAGLVHLGQISFKATTSHDGDGSALADSAEAQTAMATACRLLGVQQDVLEHALTKRTIETRGDKYTALLTVEQATDACAAVVKAIYLNMFEWIVSKVNESIKSEEDWRSSIGVLDIFGFECFEKNNFEQLCINYTNETLQQHFNRYVFKLEQAEYEREGIEWAFIEFPDNQDCLDLIETRPDGLFAQLDDECIMGQRGNDRNFVNRLYKKYCPDPRHTHARFAANVAQRRDFQFSIRHYAGIVVYESEGFLVKNKDELPPEATAVFVSSSRDLMRDSHELYQKNQSARANSGGSTPRKPGRAKRAPTVSFQFKNQLHSLMGKVNGCAPHYIRCIKPNDLNSADIFAKLRTVDQLRYGGVLEAVRVARSGFPVRLPHGDFYMQYRPLLNAEAAQSMPITTSSSPEKAQDQCKQLVNAVYEEMEEEVMAFELRCRQSEVAGNDHAHRLHRLANAKGIGSLLGNTPTFLFDRNEVQLGKNKVFMRKGAYEVLEASRTRRLGAWARRIQSLWRSHVQYCRFQGMRRVAIDMQRFYRGAKARAIVNAIRNKRSAIRIQSFFRMVIHRVAYLRLLYAVEQAQARFRGRKARLAYLKLRYETSAVKIQRTWRARELIRHEAKVRGAVVAIQCRVRRMRAKRLLSELRVEARSVGKLQQNNEELKKEIEELKTKAVKASAVANEKAYKEASGEVKELREKLAKIARELLIEQQKVVAAEREKVELKDVIVIVRQELSETNQLLMEEKSRNSQLQEDYELAREAAERTAAAAGKQPISLARSSNSRSASPVGKVALKPSNIESIREDPDLPGSAMPLDVLENGDDALSELEQFSDGEESHHSAKRTPLATRRHSSLRQSSIDGGETKEEPRAVAHLGPHGRRASAVPDVYRSKQRPETDEARPSLLDMIAHKLNISSEPMWAPTEQGHAGHHQDHEPRESSVSAFDGAIEIPDEEEPVSRIQRLHSYESHLQEFQERLRKGIEVRVWDEGAGRQGVLCSMMLKEDDGLPRLSWEHSITWRRTLFGQRTAIPDLPFFELEHIWTGHSELYGLAKKDESRYITIVASPTPTTTARSVVIMCYNRTQRNGLLQGLRKLVADIEVLGNRAQGHNLHGLTEQPQQNETSLTSLLFGGPAPPSPTPEINLQPTREQRDLKRLAISEAAQGGRMRAASSTPGSARGGNFQRLHSPELTSPKGTILPRYLEKVPPEAAEEITVKLSDVQKTIAAERLNYEKLMIQMLENQNDLNDKEDEIVNLKRQMEDMRTLLVTRDDSIRNDSQVRMRLAKRIEDLENDQTILQEENEKMALEVHELRKLKAQVEAYKKQLASIMV